MRVRSICIVLGWLSSGLIAGPRIDRHALVTRHNPVNHGMDVWSPFSVGNGEFAFTVDATGLQTFPELYEKTIPLGTLAQWGWHSFPDRQAYLYSHALKLVDTFGRKVAYAAEVNNPAAQWLRANPHRLHLGRIGFDLHHDDGSPATVDEIRGIEQKLDLWTGQLISTFTFSGQPVWVSTVCDPKHDQIAVQVRSPLLAQRRLQVVLQFSYPTAGWGPGSTDYTLPDSHQTQVLEQSPYRLRLQRQIDSTIYHVFVQCATPAHLISTEKHRFLIRAASGERLAFVCSFSRETRRRVPEPERIFHSAEKSWKSFWSSGGAIDLSACRDSLAFELERRIVLSQYLTRIQCAGSLPPQETGLTCNSWYGKFHLEMHWWHAVHFALWGRPELLEKSLAWYQSILPRARAEAQRQGYHGVRWPKMVGPDGRESPSTVGVFLIWQQPHPIYYAELLYRSHPQRRVLEKYQEMVFQSADFLASFAVWDSLRQRYVLGPPLIPAQEKHKPESTANPPFELAYWRFALQTALQWQQRLGLPKEETWAKVLAGLADLPVRDGRYQNAETDTLTFTQASRRRDHPSLLAGLGMLPGLGVDREIMRRTLFSVMSEWDWSTTWGWDFPLTAMTATRVGEPELAVKALLMSADKNRYLNNGHNFQRDGLPVYLPGNGGLLAAVALMTAGWDGAAAEEAPGFPKDGRWNVRWEGLKRMP